MQYLSKITNSHSCGHDNISSSTLKCIAHEIFECLTLIINQSITTGFFLENLKIAKIFLIYRMCQNKKDILNIHIKSEGINIFSQKFCWTEYTIFVVKCQKFTFIDQLFIT